MPITGDDEGTNVANLPSDLVSCVFKKGKAGSWEQRQLSPLNAPAEPLPIFLRSLVHLR